ncbi:unnamed protein product, partial [marine sediment metagenome]
MAAIDIGPGAVDLTSSIGDGDTNIDKANPANLSGKITSVEIWAKSNLTGCRVGIFYTTNGNTLKCRSAATLGSIFSGSKQTLTGLNLDVVAGDYIGLYWASGDMEYGFGGGADVWFTGGDHCVVDDEAAYSVGAGDIISIYGIGITVVAPTVTTPAASSVEATTATGNGNVTDNGGEDPDDRRIDWGTSSATILV